MSEADNEVLECARYGEPEDLRALLEGGANVNHRDYGGNTALHRAAANGEVECLRILREFNAQYTTNDSGNTPLHWAALNQQLEAVRFLLEQYPDQDVLAKNAAGRSALTEAFSTGNMEVVNLLLQHPSASEERFQATEDAAEGDGAEEKDGAGAEHSDEINTSNALEHEFRLADDKTIRIRELPIARADNPFGATAEEDTTGMGIWAASVLLARWCAQHPELFRDQVVVELGAGCGVPGIAAAVYAQASRVYLTDVNPTTLENLQYNVSLNAEAAASPDAMQVSTIDWSNGDTWPAEPATILIGADLVYSRDILPLLTSAVAGLLAPGGKFYYIAPDTGRDGLEELPAAMAAVGLVQEQVTPIADELFENPLASQNVEAYMLHFMDLVARTAHNLHVYHKAV